jgi:anti-sigma-K factor RskA
MTAADVHSLAGPYALDALTEFEAAAFARHLAECETCAVEVAEYLETAGRLAEVNWSVPPPRLRRSVLDQVSRTRQTVGAPRPTGPAHAASSGASWRRRTFVAAAAAVLAIAGGVATWVVAQDRLGAKDAQIVAARQEAAEVRTVLSAPDAKLVRAGRVSLVVSGSRNEGVAVLDDLPATGAGRTYQLWMIRKDGARSVKVLTAGQTTGSFLVGQVAGAEKFGVSLEPAGGSKAPTDVKQVVDLPRTA